MNQTSSTAAALYAAFQSRGIELTAEPTEMNLNGTIIHDWRIWASKGQFAPGDWDKVKRFKNGLVRILCDNHKIEHRLGDTQEQISGFTRFTRTGKATVTRHEPEEAIERPEIVFAPLGSQTAPKAPKRAENWMEGRVKPKAREIKPRKPKAPVAPKGPAVNIPKNELGNRYGRLLVVAENPVRTKQGCVKWDCLCDCGKTVAVVGASLRNGGAKSCGYAPKVWVKRTPGKGRPSRKPLEIGTKCGMWTVTGTATEKNSTGSFLTPCRCECGSERVLSIRDLIRPDRPSLSCGCVRIPRITWAKADFSKTTEELMEMFKCTRRTVQNRRAMAGLPKMPRKSNASVLLFAGMRLGRLSLVQPVGPKKWECACDCGKVLQLTSKSLRCSKARLERSCGCVAFKVMGETKRAQAAQKSEQGG